jgi:hypothetical protein
MRPFKVWHGRRGLKAYFATLEEARAMDVVAITDIRPR